MLIHPLPKSKQSFWDYLKSLFMLKSPELAQVADKGKTIPSAPTAPERKPPTFPDPSDF